MGGLGGGSVLAQGLWVMGWVVMRMERVRRTTPVEGGETVFPQAATRVSGPEWSECASKGLAVKTRRGDALLFYRSVSASPLSHFF